MQNLLYTLGLKKKSRREKVQDAVTDTVHSIADSVDELVDDTRRKGPRMARRARKRFKAAEKGASKAVDSAKEQVADVAESVGERVSDAAESVRGTSTEARERVSGAASSATADASAAVAAAVATLASLNLDWEAILKSLHRDLESATPEKDDTEKAGKAAKHEAKHEAKQSKEKAKAKAKKRKGRKFPGFWIWLLRLGIGYLFVERLRSRDIPAYVDHQAADQMRQQATSHPVAWYKDLLDTLFIPNASIFAAVTVAAEVLAALGLLTGVNRRLSTLLGLAVAGNDLLAEVQDADERGQNVLLVLAQLLLLRTGG